MRMTAVTNRRLLRGAMRENKSLVGLVTSLSLACGCANAVESEEGVELGAAAEELSFTPPGPDPFDITGAAAAAPDFDQDGKADLAVWRESDGTWYVLHSSTGYTSGFNTQWGTTGDIPLKRSDFDGDGKADIAVFRQSDYSWHWKTSGSNYVDGFSRQWGEAGDVLITGTDFDGDKKTDIAVWRPSDGVWYIRRSDQNWNAGFQRQLGQSDDVPIANTDFDGDKKADIAVYRPSDRTWHVRQSSKNYWGLNNVGVFSRQWGEPGDIPIFGTDFDGDKKTDIAQFRPSNGTWYVLRSSVNSWAASGAFSRQWGQQGDIPLANTDVDGDGKADIVIWRPGNGTWYVRQSSKNYWGLNNVGVFNRQWGQTGDIPFAGTDVDGDKKADFVVWRPSTGTWYLKTSKQSWNDGQGIQWGTTTDIPLGGR
jgi:hypothetical protein